MLHNPPPFFMDESGGVDERRFRVYTRDQPESQARYLYANLTQKEAEFVLRLHNTQHYAAYKRMEERDEANQ